MNPPVGGSLSGVAARLRRLARILAAAALVGCVVTLLGWFLGVPRMTDWGGDRISMFANTALAGTFAALGVLFANATSARRVAATTLCGVLACAIAGATLVEHLGGVDLGIDTLLVIPRWGQRAASVPGRMGPPGATSLTLLGVALALLVRGATARLVAAGLAVCVILITLTSLAGYLFGADTLYAVPAATGIAMQTALLLLLVAVAVVASVPDRGPVRILSQDSAAGEMARRGLVFIVVLPLAVGRIVVAGHRAGLYDAAMAIAILAVALISMLCIVLWRSVRAVSLREEAKRHAETALAAREQEHRQQREFLEQLVSCSPVPIAIVRGAELRYDVVNPAYQAMAGTDPIVGRRFDEVFPDAASRGATDHLNRVLATGEPWHMRDFETLLRDGSRAWWDGEAVTLCNAEGSRDAALLLTWPITERKSLLEREREAREEAEHALKLKDEFLATLSHELRTPLNAIVGWVHLLKVDKGDVDTVDRAVEVIDRNARLQAQLISDLLDMSRIVSGKMRIEERLIDLAEVVRAAVDSVQPAAAAKGLRLQAELGDGSFPSLGDANRLQQVLWNLISNAVKFTPRDGTVAVSLRRADSHVVIEVADTGEGIEAQFLPHIFERFRQADASASRRHGGLGIGLALVKELVELHGGTVEASSGGKGRGSRFVVTLPQALEASAADGRESGVRDDGAARVVNDLRGVHVLIVDDDPDALDVARRILRAQQAEVVTAACADEALLLVDSRPLDVIVSDVAMPHRSGYDLIAEIRGRGVRTPAAALTAFARAEDRDRAASSGFQAHVSKPIDAATLVEVVRELAASGGARPIEATRNDR